MRAHLVEITVEGFRAIRTPLRLELLQPAGEPLQRVVLAGPNGSGKTSVLEAVILALGREDLLLRDLPASERGDHWRTEIPPGARIELRCRYNILFELKVVRTADEWTLQRFRGGEILADERDPTSRPARGPLTSPARSCSRTSSARYIRRVARQVTPRIRIWPRPWRGRSSPSAVSRPNWTSSCT